MSIAETTTGSLLIAGGDVLTPAGLLRDHDLAVVDGRIAEIAPALGAADRRLDAVGCLVLPGIVDLHGDAFERCCTPRAGVDLPLPLAIAENDAALVACGITTFAYAVTDGFEPGTRSREHAARIIRQVRAERGRLRCDSLVHVRHETVATQGHAELLGWIADGTIDILSLNDHLPDLSNERQVERNLAGLRRRVKMSDDEARAFFASLTARRGEGERQIEELVIAAHAAGVALASHDDDSAEAVARSAARGVRISEFPTAIPWAEAARAAGAATLYGAPNVVRGGSHVGAVDVTEAVRVGVVDALCSDYHYPSLLAAPFALVERGVLDLAAAWALVSANPARAAAMADRGVLVPGRRADCVVLARGDATPSGLRATLVAGRPVLAVAGQAGLSTLA